MRMKNLIPILVAAGLLSGCAGVQHPPPSMKQRVINPWTWQDQFGFVQATEIQGAQRLLFVAGQASFDAQGNPVHAGDMKAQVTQALDNLETVLKAADFDMSNIVRITLYTTDVDLLLAHHDIIVQRITKAGGRFGSTLVGVTRLAAPGLMFEIEATAVK